MSVFYLKGEGTVSSNVTAVTRSSDGDGQTITLPAGLLVANGDWIRITALCDCTGLTGVPNLVFGATTLSTVPGLAAFSGGIIFEGLVFRTGAATQKAIGTFMRNGSVTDTAAFSPTETLANTITIKTTLTSRSAGSIDFNALVIEVGRV